MDRLKDAELMPLGGRILVRPDTDEEETEGGIVIPEVARAKPNTGEVLRLGHPRRDQHGQDIPFRVKIGDYVVYSAHAGFEIKVNGQAYLMMSEEELLAIVEPKGTA